MEAVEHCALCGMEIHAAPVVRVIDGAERHFDTEDCARLYEVAAEQGLLDVVLAESPEHRHGLLHTLTSKTESAYFTLNGMWCASCASVAEKVLMRADGIEDAQVSFAAGKGRIDYDPAVTDLDGIKHQLERLGYQPSFTETGEDTAAGRGEERLLLQVLVAFAFGMQEMVLYIVMLYPAYGRGDFVSTQVRLLQYLALILATPALFYGGITFLRGAYHELLARHPGMDTLVALGTLSAYSYSVWAALVGGHATYFDSVTMIVQFVILGRYLEMAGGARARKDVRGLLELQPDRAWVRLDSGRLEQVPSWQVEPGETLVVKPGERVPVDARVETGTGHADESLLTGEPAAVSKRPDDTLWAGTLVVDGSITAVALRDAATSRLSSIRGLVETTLEGRAPVERLADRAALYLTMAVIVIAVLTGVVWTALGTTPSQALITAVAVLVVACPCALGLATPLAVSIALGGAAREGVLIRNGAALETATHTTDVVFDKTGTVTMGRLQVTGAEGAEQHDSLVCAAAAVEQYSEHPLARAIVAACPDAPQHASDFAGEPGLGVSAKTGESGATVRVGRLEWLGAEPAAPIAESAARRAAEGQTIVWVGRDAELLGFIALRDELDPTAKTAVAELRTRGLGPLLLSGDSPETTRAVAAELGIERFESRLTPEMKAEHIGRLQAEGRHVAMVGDGVNDAPSLARADLSITVSGGADVAGQTSDVVLSRDDLELVPWFLEASGKTRRIIVENLFWALAYNAVMLPLAALGYVTPGIAAVVMASSSLLVVGNSLRLRGLLRRIDAQAVSATASEAASAG